MNNPARFDGKDDGFRNRRNSDAGFTLVELLVVLAIIALVATIAAPQVLHYLGAARTNAAKAQVRNIESALELYFVDNGSYPSNEEGLNSLVAPPKDGMPWTGPYLKGAGGLTDPWGRPYGYQLNGDGSAFVVRTLGRDGKSGGEGEDQDVSN